MAKRERLKLSINVSRVLLRSPTQIAGYTFTHAETVVVSVERLGCIGLGEANGLYFRGETTSTILAELEALRSIIEAGITRAEVQAALPAGGARNVLDCALWALESHESERPIWDLAGLAMPVPTHTVRTIFAGEPDEMAGHAEALHANARLKLKLLGDCCDAARIRAVRRARPQAWIMVDANQAMDRASYLELLPAIQDTGIQIIEQPFPIGREAWLDDLPRPTAIAADECALTRADLSRIVGRFDMVNIKLDKAGGFTEALAMAQEAKRLGLRLMVGCMGAGSLAMAPAYLVGQLCEVCDIDGPLYLTEDRTPGLDYQDDVVTMPDGVWGR